ncbi:MAG: PadR family transcriptional regulator [Dehalococcoidia bacterium]|nr:PadR family transcriptional regulator [Dehalococcoidia bacterium]
MNEPIPPGGRDPASTIGRNIEAFLLLELLREPSYGYDLIRRLADYGFRRVPNEPAAVYKLLRALEESGAIASRWDTEGSGPARRYYEITGPGIALLHERAGHLDRLRLRIERFMERYAALAGPAGGVGGVRERAEGDAAVTVRGGR